VFGGKFSCLIKICFGLRSVGVLFIINNNSSFKLRMITAKFNQYLND
jgi:hypothetical protein